MRLLSTALLTLLASLFAPAQTYTISTFAGGGLPVNVPGTSASIRPQSVAADGAGNLFFANQSTILRLDAKTGIVTLVAGNGTAGFSGDNGPATSAQLYLPSGVAVDSSDNLYIADTQNHRIRKVSNGVIATVAAASETVVANGSDGPATSGQLYQPSGVAVDSAGNLYIADPSCYCVLKVANGAITTVAGTGSPGFSGDNSPAVRAQLNRPEGVAVDSAGNLYIADTLNSCIRKVSAGVITTVAGSGYVPGFSGDGGPAINALLDFPVGLAIDSVGNLYIADYIGGRVRKVAGGVITTVAGTGATEFSGDNGPATSAQLNEPQGVAVDDAGSLYIADTDNNRIRKVSSGVITTVVGNGIAGFGGDNGPAASAQLDGPAGVAADNAGSVYIADTGDNLVRKVYRGIITTVAGNGSAGFSGDNGPATGAQLHGPAAVAVDATGNLYIADAGNSRIRKVSGGVITTVVGNGTAGFGGDNGPATSAELEGPSGVAIDAAGNLYIADTNNQRIRMVSNGVITTIAGGMTGNISCNNGLTVNSQLSFPQGVTVDSAANLYIADSSDNCIRKVTDGMITTVAGNLGGGFGGDNGPATSAQLAEPLGIAVDSAANLYIADSGNNRIRKVSNGVITTIAGGGTQFGDNGPATAAQFSDPLSVAADSAGNVYVADYYNNRIRLLTPPGAPSINPGGAVNAASSAAGSPVAPGSIASVYGSFLIPALSTASITPLPIALAGLSLQFGSGQSAPLFAVSGGQINFQVPWELAGASQTSLSATINGQTSMAQALTLAPFAPGIFSMNGQGTGQGAILDTAYTLVNAANPATAGSTILQIYCTGLGAVTNQPPSGSPPLSNQLSQTTTTPTVTIGGVQAQVLFSGLAPGSVGEYQVDALVPAGSSKGAAVPVAIVIGGSASNTVTIAVQ